MKIEELQNDIISNEELLEDISEKFDLVKNSFRSYGIHGVRQMESV